MIVRPQNDKDNKLESKCEINSTQAKTHIDEPKQVRWQIGDDVVWESLTKNEYELCAEIFHGDNEAFNNVTSWIRERPFRRKKLPGRTRPVCVGTLNEIEKAIGYMLYKCPREGTRRWRYMLRFIEFYNSKSKYPYEW